MECMVLLGLPPLGQSEEEDTSTKGSALPQLVSFILQTQACIIRLINSCFWKQRNVWIRKCLNYSAFYWNYSQHIKYISSQQKQQHSPIYMGYFQGSLPILKYVQQKLFALASFILSYFLTDMLDVCNHTCPNMKHVQPQFQSYHHTSHTINVLAWY